MKAIGIAAIIMIFAFSACWAGGATVDDSVKCALHVVAHGATCKSLPAISSVGDINTTWTWPGEGTDIDVFFIVFDYDSIYNFDYALRWPADWGTAVYTVCAPALHLGEIINPSDYSTIGYQTCRVPVSKGGTSPDFLIASWIWLAIASAPAEVEIIANPNVASNSLAVIDCRDPLDARKKHYMKVQYNAGINMTPYVGPPYTETEPTTWGAIKAMFE